MLAEGQWQEIFSVGSIFEQISEWCDDLGDNIPAEEIPSINARGRNVVGL